MLLRRIARPMLAAAFIGQGIDALRSPKVAADTAGPTLEILQKLPAPVSANVPADAATVAKVTAAVQIAGGLLLASGRVPRLASAALAATVIPANLGAHMFWTEVDPERKAAKRRDFLTDVSLLGGLVIAAADTAGKPSLGWRSRRAAARLGETVAAALPSGADSDLVDRVGHRVQEGLTVGSERGREFASTAVERGAPLLESALDRATTAAEKAADRAAPVLEAARERGAAAAAEKAVPLLESARDRGTELAHAAAEHGDELAAQARTKALAWRRH